MFMPSYKPLTIRVESHEKLKKMADDEHLDSSMVKVLDIALDFTLENWDGFTDFWNKINAK